jgi:hypothetical protein
MDVMIFHILKKSIVAKGCKLSLCTLKFIRVTEFQTTKAYSNLNLTKAEYNVNKLYKVENENVIVRICMTEFPSMF